MAWQYGGELPDGGVMNAVILMMAAVVAAMPDPLAEIRYRRQLCREAWEAGHAEGWRKGYEQGARLREAEWRRIVAPLGGPTHAELELRRWGSGGREHFGDLRPSDYMPQRRRDLAS